MARSNPQMIFLYLLLPAIFIIFIYSFIFAKFSISNQPYINGNGNLRYPIYLFNNQSIENDTVTVKSPNGASEIEIEMININEFDDEDIGKTTITFKELSKSSALSSTSLIKANLDELEILKTRPHDTSLWSKINQDRYHDDKPKFPLKVIIIPHSHNDPGWLNTYDQYFYHYTYYVLENVVKNLEKYPNMTFVWAEMSYFSRWWDSLNSDIIKENVQKLMDEKRFEIVTGGWVMNDEGSAHYFDMIDQLIEGHQFLRANFKTKNYKPKNSWSIDPFGHSSTFSYILQQSGIDKIYIQRTHYAWKRYLSEKRYLEFFWKQPFQNDHFRLPLCHMSPLPLYSFKYACGPDFKVCLEFDFRKIYGENSESTATALNSTNIDQKAKKILKQYSKLGSLFPHNVALVLLGDDFRYNFDIEWQQQYKNYMFLMDYVNSNGAKFNHSQIQFGTLDDYFTAIDERLPINEGNYPTLEGDFIPYADVYVDPDPSYWTGYFTTRPYFKSLTRELQHWLRGTEIIYSLARNIIRQHSKNYLNHLSSLLDREYNVLTNARQNLALFQHHDGITGTSKDFVMEDYGHRLSHSLNTLMGMFARIVQYLNLDEHTIKHTNNTKQFIFATNSKSKWHQITEQEVLKIPSFSEGSRLLVFNPLTQIRTEPIKILTDDPFISIWDLESDQKITHQVNPVFIDGKLSSSVFEIEIIDSFYPLALKNYKIQINEESLETKVTIFQTDLANKIDHTNEAFQFEKSTQNDYFLENDFLVVSFDYKGYMNKIHLKHSNKTQYVRMSFISYESKPEKSGAYLLKFIHTNPYPDLFFQQRPRINLFKGALSSTITVNYSEISYSVKLYNQKSNIGKAIQLKLMVDLENKADYDNQEIAIRLITNISNRKTIKNRENYRTFYVDSNGFQLFERHFIEAIGVEGNYYPMTSSFFIQDHDWRFTVLSSYVHGATSPQDGMVEIMLDRRIVEDDKRGLSEGVLDNLPVESSFWLVLEEMSSLQTVPPSQVPQVSKPPILSKLADSILLLLNYPSMVMYSYRIDQEVTKIQSKHYYRNRYFISPNLLCKYFLLNLRTLPSPVNFNHPSKSSLMILQHRVSFETNQMDSSACDDSNLSKPLTHLFNDVRVAHISKVSLTGLENLEKINFISDLNVPPFQILSFNVTFV